MNENSVIPSLDKIMNAVNSDLMRTYNEQSQDSGGELASKIESIFDANEWYLQDYTENTAAEQEEIDKFISNMPDDIDLPKKSNKGKIIALIIAAAFIVTFLIWLFL